MKMPKIMSLMQINKKMMLGIMTVVLVVIIGVTSWVLWYSLTKPSFSIVTFPSNGLTLTGYLWLPAGFSSSGHYAAVIFNHGSDPSVPPREGHILADFYNAHGFIFFMPIRHGHLPSPGNYRTTIDQLFAEESDVEAGIAYLKSLPYIDASRLVVSGGSNGGIMSLLTADAGLGVKAAIAFAPGAESWNNVDLRQRLITAASKITIPTFIIQANNDYSLGPSETLGPIITSNNIRPHEAKVYPSYGTTAFEGHAHFTTQATSVWGQDVLQFIQSAFGENR